MAGGKGDGGEVVLQTAWLRRFYHSLHFYHIEPSEADSSSAIEVLYPGEINWDGGPDFFNARLRIGSIVWAGNVEVHRKASEWLKHKHHLDPAYDSTILHVVVENDLPIYSRLTGAPLFTCVMDLRPVDLERATDYLQHEGALPCSERDLDPLPISWHSWSQSLFAKRIIAKAQRFISLYETSGSDLGTVLHLLLLRYLGSRVNNEAFEQVARSLPLRVIRKHTDRLPMLEALYLGQAALLEDTPVDSYQEDLAERYRFLRTKYQLTPAPRGEVRLLRLRPSAFPHRRLAYMAALRHRYPLLESELMRIANAHELQQLLDVPPSDYWQLHYTFGAEAEKALVSLSASTIDSLFLNVLIPFPLLDAYAHGVEPSAEALEEAWARASQLKPEKNSITNRFAAIKLPQEHAAHSQAALELWDSLCSHRSCYLCPLGRKLFSHSATL